MMPHAGAGRPVTHRPTAPVGPTAKPFIMVFGPGHGNFQNVFSLPFAAVRRA